MGRHNDKRPLSKPAMPDMMCHDQASPIIVSVPADASLAMGGTVIFMLPCIFH